MKLHQVLKVSALLLAALASVDAVALTPMKRSGTIKKPCRNHHYPVVYALPGKELCQDCQKREASKKAELTKNAIKHTSSAKTDIIEIPEDAKDVYGRLIQLDDRIAELCGYELGKIARKTDHPKVDENGDIIVTEKLRKPFRRCTHVTLKYSAKNGALYSIRLFSEPQKKVNDSAAWKEVQSMHNALKEKFATKVSSCSDSSIGLHKQKIIHLSGVADQTIIIAATQKEFQNRAVLKGPATKKDRGWEFSLTLEDLCIKRIVPPYDVTEPQYDAKGSDVL